MRCIWGQLPPVCASAFLCAQRGLSQLEGECMPGRLLPPHQACPLAPSVSPSFLQSDSHTAWIILLPLFFCLFTPSNSLPEKPGHYSMLTNSPRVSEHMQHLRPNFNAAYGARALVKGSLRNWGALWQKCGASPLYNYPYAESSKLLCSFSIQTGSLLLNRSLHASSICYTSLFLAINGCIIVYSLVACPSACESYDWISVNRNTQTTF